MGNKKDDSCRVQKSSFIPELGVFLTVSTKWGPVHKAVFIIVIPDSDRESRGN